MIRCGGVVGGWLYAEWCATGGWLCARGCVRGRGLALCAWLCPWQGAGSVPTLTPTQEDGSVRATATNKKSGEKVKKDINVKAPLDTGGGYALLLCVGREQHA